jgi:hypothetical protein
MLDSYLVFKPVAVHKHNTKTSAASLRVDAAHQ